jgi:hypothetical protein
MTGPAFARNRHHSESKNDELRMTRGRCGSLILQRMTLSFTTPRRFIPAHREHEELWGSRRRALEFNVEVICSHPTTPHAALNSKLAGEIKLRLAA